MHRNFTECPTDAQKVDRCGWKIPLPFGMLTEGPAGARKLMQVYEISADAGKLTKGAADAQNVDRWSLS